MKLEKLKEKIQPHEIQWRVQSKGNGKTTVVPYLTNRCVMERFDEQFGYDGWQNTFEQWRTKGVKCGISVFIDGQWITKYDGADETNIEATKGGFSDSMKRAAVQWGLGRDLYDYPMIQIEGEHKYIPRWAEPQLAAYAAQISLGSYNGNYILISQSSQPKPAPTPKSQRVIVTEGDENYMKIIKGVASGKATLQQALDKFNISEEVEASLKEKITALADFE